MAAQVHLGDRLTIQGQTPEWYYARLPDGTFGWVMARYTRSVIPDAKG